MNRDLSNMIDAHEGTEWRTRHLKVQHLPSDYPQPVFVNLTERILNSYGLTSAPSDATVEEIADQEQRWGEPLT